MSAREREAADGDEDEEPETERAAVTAFLPVSSATRRRVLDTAGAVLLYLK